MGTSKNGNTAMSTEKTYYRDPSEVPTDHLTKELVKRKVSIDDALHEHFEKRGRIINEFSVSDSDEDSVCDSDLCDEMIIDKDIFTTILAGYGENATIVMSKDSWKGRDIFWYVAYTSLETDKEFEARKKKYVKRKFKKHLHPEILEERKKAAEQAKAMKKDSEDYKLMLELQKKFNVHIQECG